MGPSRNCASPTARLSRSGLTKRANHSVALFDLFGARGPTKARSESVIKLRERPHWIAAHFHMDESHESRNQQVVPQTERLPARLTVAAKVAAGRQPGRSMIPPPSHGATAPSQANERPSCVARARQAGWISRARDQDIICIADCTTTSVSATEGIYHRLARVLRLEAPTSRLGRAPACGRPDAT